MEEGRGDCKSRRNGEGGCCETVSPRDVRSYALKVSPKHEPNKEDNSKHASTEGECSPYTILSKIKEIKKK